MGVFFPRIDSPQLHVLVHSTQDFLPVSLCFTISVRVEAQGVEDLGLVLLIDLVKETICASDIEIVLTTPFEEEEVIVECLSQISLSHLHGDAKELGFLHFLRFAYALPFAHGDT